MWEVIDTLLQQWCYCGFYNSPNHYCRMVIRRVFNCFQYKNSKTGQSKEMHGDTSLEYPSLLSIILETYNGKIQQRLEFAAGGVLYYTCTYWWLVFFAIKSLKFINFLHCTDGYRSHNLYRQLWQWNIHWLISSKAYTGAIHFICRGENAIHKQ